MQLHEESGDGDRTPIDGEVKLLDPVMQVIVLPAPAVEGVGVAVHLGELVPGDGRDPAEVVVVLQPVAPLVDGHAHVLRIVERTFVKISAIEEAKTYYCALLVKEGLATARAI